MNRITKFWNEGSLILIPTRWLLAVSVAVFVVQPLLFSLDASAGDGKEGRVDWSMGAIQATGTGFAPDRMKKNPGQARAAAKRAAHSVAMGRLLELVEDIHVDSTTVVKNYVLESDVVKTNVRGILNGARVVKETPLPDGSYETTLEINLANVQQSLKLTSVSPPRELEWKGTPQIPQAPKDMEYTGLIVDAVGLSVQECLNPKIVMEDGQVVYSQGFVDSNILANHHVAGYVKGLDEARRHDRVTANPLMIKALALAEGSHTDLVIHQADAQLVHLDPKHLDFLKKAKVLIVY